MHSIMVSNHGGRQLDGSRSPFDQLAEIVDTVGDKLDVICEEVFIEELICLKHYRSKACSVKTLSLCTGTAGNQVLREL